MVSCRSPAPPADGPLPVNRQRTVGRDRRLKSANPIGLTNLPSWIYWANGLCLADEGTVAGERPILRKNHRHPLSWNVAWNQGHRSKDGVHSCKDNHIRKTRMSHGINSIGQKWGQNVMKKHPHPLSWNVTWNQQDRSKRGARP